MTVEVSYGEVLADLELVGRWLARRDLPGATDGASYDVLVLCGSSVLRSLEVAADAVRDGVVRKVLVTGGVGHSTSHLVEAVASQPTYGGTRTAGRTEAEILGELLVDHLRVAPHDVLLEPVATNCGENASYSLAMVHGTARSLLVVQDPTMQRRTQATFERAAAGTTVERIDSWAPLLPVVTRAGVEDERGDRVWALDRFTELVLGELRRLHDDEHGYGPRGTGFIDHVELPPEVRSAWSRLRGAHPDGARGAWHG